MPKYTKKKKNATQPPRTKRRSTRLTAATSGSNANNGVTSRTADETATTSTSTSETATQPPQTQELISQLSSVIQLLTTSLSGNAPISNPHTQAATPNDSSAEVLSEASDNLTMNPPPATVVMDNPRTSATDPLFSATQSPTVSLPAVPSRLKDKIISGELIDFTLLLSKAMFSGTHSSEPSKCITVHLNPEKDDFSVSPTPTLCKIYSFLAWMEAWNIYLAILIDHAPAHAPQLVACQRTITSASNQYPLMAWLNYDVHFRTLAALEPLLRWNVRLTYL